MKLKERIPMNTDNLSVWRININSDWSRFVLTFVCVLGLLSFFFYLLFSIPVKNTALTLTNAALTLAFTFAIVLIPYSLLVYFPAVLIRTIFRGELRRRVEEARKRKAEEDFVHLHLRPISRGDRISKKAVNDAIRFAKENGILTEEVIKGIHDSVSAGTEARDSRRNKEIVFFEGAKESMLDMVKEERNIRRITIPTFRINITNRIVHRVEPGAEIKKTDKVFTFGHGPTKFKILVNINLLNDAEKILIFRQHVDGGIFPVTLNPLH